MTNLANKAKMTYTIVSESEANLREGKISIKTPIAQGLLNKKVGDEVEIKIPRGTIKPEDRQNQRGMIYDAGLGTGNHTHKNNKPWTYSRK